MESSKSTSSSNSEKTSYSIPNSLIKKYFNDYATSTLSLWNYNLDTKTLCNDVSKQNYTMIDTIIGNSLKTYDKNTIFEYLTHKYTDIMHNNTINSLDKSTKESQINEIVRKQINIIFGSFIARLYCYENK